MKTIEQVTAECAQRLASCTTTLAQIQGLTRTALRLYAEGEIAEAFIAIDQAQTLEYAAFGNASITVSIRDQIEADKLERKASGSAATPTDRAETFPDLLGHTMVRVTYTEDQMLFVREDGRKFRFFHLQDCCESVKIYDITGDLEDLVDSPILLAEATSRGTTPEESEYGTWTFYRFATVKGSVTVRWIGESNGYYSERVDFEEVR